MGWLTTLATKVVPRLWTSGAQATSTVWGAGAKVAGAAARNPKTAAVVGIGSYAGWSKMGTDNSLGTAVGQTVRQGVDYASGFSHDAVNGFTGKDTVEQVTDTVGSVVDSTGKTITELKDTATQTKGLLGTLGDTLQGLSSFLGNIFGGNGMNMFGNFLGNLASGKVSGLGIGGLIAAAYLMFGRTGLLGKIGGALMAMMLIGSNSINEERRVNSEESIKNEESKEKEQCSMIRR